MGEPALLLPASRSASWQVVAIHQPNLMPRLKVLQKLVSAGAWVVLDNVQFTRRDWQARTRMRPLGDPDREFWVSIPVHCPSGRSTAIRDVRIADAARCLHVIEGSIRQAYGRSTHWPWIARYLATIRHRATTNLAQFGVDTTTVALSMLGLAVRLVYASELEGIRAARSRRLLSICHRLDAQAYLCGSGGGAYLDRSLFERGAVDVLYHEWTPPLIPTPLDRLPWRNITFLDMVARCGPVATRNHLMDRRTIHHG